MYFFYAETGPERLELSLEKSLALQCVYQLQETKGAGQGYTAQHWNQFMEVDGVVLSLLSKPSAIFHKDFHPPSPLNDCESYCRHILYTVKEKTDINRMELRALKAGGR